MRRQEYAPNERTRQNFRKRTNEMDISNQPGKVFKVIPIKILTRLGRRMNTVRTSTKRYKKEPIRAEEYNN